MKLTSRRNAFTLVELLVVISIFVLLLALAVPAFSSMLYSSEQSLAEVALRNAISATRDFAARSPAGQDAAAVFTYDRESRKTSIIICTSAGVLQDAPPINSPRGTTLRREVFAAAPGLEPIQLTTGWTVRGYAPPAWFTDTPDNNAWYERTYPRNGPKVGHWMFPETSFYNAGVKDDGDDRQSFMVRFEGGTGLLKASDPSTVLVLSPSTEVVLRRTWFDPPTGYGIADNPLNADNEPDHVRFVRRVLAWPTLTTVAGAITPARKVAILGNKSSDTILVKPVGQLALCSERKLASGIGASVDKDSGSLYLNAIDPALIGGFSMVGQIDDWIQGYDNTGAKLDSDCRVFTIHRYLGWLQEVTGTKNGEGVGL